MCRIVNSCIVKAVIVIIIVDQLSVNSFKKLVRTIKSLTKTKLIFVFTWFAINEPIYNNMLSPSIGVRAN